MVRLPPPGTLCLTQAILELVADSNAETFCEIGPGAGDLSAALCHAGLHGIGVELSSSAAEIARDTLGKPIEEGQFRLVEGDFMEIDDLGSSFDLAVSMMVMEHVQDDAAFLGRMTKLVRPGGTVLIGVPARMDRWGIDDETAGHFRRYEKTALVRALKDAGLERAQARSVAVPIANLTFHISNMLVGRAGEARKLALSQRARTDTSGIRDISFKTTFPSSFRFLLNPVAMRPLFWLQRRFYATALGLTLLGYGGRPN